MERTAGRVDRRTGCGDAPGAHVAAACLTALLATLACGTERRAASLPGPATPPSSAVVAVASGEPPLEFVLDPVDRDREYGPESSALRGKRAIVLVVTTYDTYSLLALRNLAPLFRALPADAACLLVAKQPLNDRVIISVFMDSEKTPCRRAIADPSRGRLGDLKRVNVIPTTLVLRKDGTMVGGVTGAAEESEVRVLLERAK